jgi:hypothetical protein
MMSQRSLPIAPPTDQPLRQRFHGLSHATQPLCCPQTTGIDDATTPPRLTRLLWPGLYSIPSATCPAAQQPDRQTGRERERGRPAVTACWPAVQHDGFVLLSVPGALRRARLSVARKGSRSPDKQRPLPLFASSQQHVTQASQLSGRVFLFFSCCVWPPDLCDSTTPWYSPVELQRPVLGHCVQPGLWDTPLRLPDFFLNHNHTARPVVSLSSLSAVTVSY